MNSLVRPVPWKGLNTERAPVFIGYDQAERMVSALLDRAMRWKPEAVVGIARGGLIPATMASATLALPLFMLRCDRASGVVSWIGEPPRERRLLVVDDSCSTGETLRRVTAVLHDQRYACLTMTVVHDPEVTSFTPDLSHAMTALFRLPWERGEATPTARALRASGATTERRLVEAPFLGLDLDGIFLPDLPRTDYAADLAATLQRRHGLPPCDLLPEFDPAHAVIITGRHIDDRSMTLEWLARCGHETLPVEFRPHDVSDDIAAVARYKARVATRWGCTHFIESEAEQAIRIASAAPHLIVSWWSAGDGRSFVVGSAESPDQHAV